MSKAKKVSFPKIDRCPFGCLARDKHSGERNVVLICHSDVREDYVIGYTVQCNACGVEVSDEYVSSTVALWNKRPRRSSRARADSV